MLRQLALLLALAPAASALHAQAPAAPTPDQLMQWLDTAHRRMNLIADDSPAFHPVAQHEDYPVNQPIDKLSLEEVWRAPIDYKTTILHGGVPFSERHTPTVLTVEPPAETGKWRIPTSMVVAEMAVFSPFPKLIAGSHRVSLEPNYQGITNLDCIAVEPELPNVPADIPIAVTTYCLARGNHLLRRIYLPNQTQINLDDIAPFNGHYIPRTITVLQGGQVAGRMHVATIEPATDFSALEQSAPTDAKHYAPRRQDASYIMGSTMPGQLVYRPSTHDKTQSIFDATPMGTMQLQLQINTAGAVTDVQILHSANPTLNPWAIQWGKKLRFRSAYQGDHLVPFTVYYTLDFGGKDD